MTFPHAATYMDNGSTNRDPGNGSGNGPVNRIVDLNTVDEATLAGLPMVGPDKARRLIEHRPYKDWLEVEKIPGVGSGIVDILAMAGVQLSPGHIPKA